MGKVLGDVELLFWDGGCIFLGSAGGQLSVHAHQAIQISFGRGGNIRLRPSDAAPWRSYPVGIVGSHQPHAFDATEVSVGATLFIEPETREGRAFTELYLADSIGGVDPAIAADEKAELLERFLARCGDAAVVEAARAVIQALTRGVRPLLVSDERITRAVFWINANLQQQITLEEVAATVFLSPGRFRHLFVEQMGMGMRPYVLWRRFMRSWEMMMNGDTISRAAHAARFADVSPPRKRG